jgi:hypothetical protein
MSLTVLQGDANPTLPSEPEVRPALSAKPGSADRLAAKMLNLRHAPALAMAVARSLKANIAGHSASIGRSELGIFLQLPQDLDVVLPVIDGLSPRPDVRLTVFMLPRLFSRSPRVARALRSRGITPLALSPRLLALGATNLLNGLRGLLTASESSLPPHRKARAIVEAARSVGVPTYLLQHGIECVGLTHFEGKQGHPAAFASDHIFTWTEPAQLPAGLEPETRAKCLAVGRPHPAHGARVNLPVDLANRKVVGVFENLHWDRYSGHYRQNVVRDLEGFCRARPDLTVLVKPHFNSRALLGAEATPLRQLPNVIMASHLDPLWEPFTAPDLLPSCFAAITTPSTVALDAAEHVVPVAIARYGLELPAFAGLPMLEGLPGWINFIADVEAGSTWTQSLIAYANRLRLPGDAAARIAEIMLGG